MFKGLYNFVEKLRPTFSEGGKLHVLHSVFDGFDTFLFTPNTTSKRIGTQIHDGSDSKRTMILVVMALVPAMLFGMFNVGYQHLLATGELVRGGMTCALWWKAFGFGLLAVLPYILVSYAVGLGIEFTVAQWKKEEIQEGFLVTGFIIPLIVPINTPLWMVAIATAFAVIFAKEVFGGTGYNIFNVALITRAFLFFAYPTHMTGDAAFVRTGGTWGWDSGKTVVDGFSGATPLTQIATTTDANLIPVDFWTAFNGLIPGSVGETCCWAILLGALLLLTTGVASWKTMLSIFVGGGLTAWLFNVCGPDTAAAHFPWYMQLITGGFAFGAVFMATDPVTSARTECGKWIYGLLIGFMAVVIRVLNPGYPEGMMLAILLMNAFAPLIDWCVVQVNIKRRMKRANSLKSILFILVVATTFCGLNGCKKADDTDVTIATIESSNSTGKNVKVLTNTNNEVLEEVLPERFVEMGKNVEEATTSLLQEFYSGNMEFSEYDFYNYIEEKCCEHKFDGFSLDLSSEIQDNPAKFYNVMGKINQTLWQNFDYIELPYVMARISYEISEMYDEYPGLAEGLYTYLTFAYYSYITIVQYEPYEPFLDDGSWEMFVCNVVTGAIGTIHGTWIGGIMGGGLLGAAIGAGVGTIIGAALSTIVCEEPPQPVEPKETEEYWRLLENDVEYPKYIDGYAELIPHVDDNTILGDNNIVWCFPQSTLGWSFWCEYPGALYEFQNAFVQLQMFNLRWKEYNETH